MFKNVGQHFFTLKMLCQHVSSTANRTNMLAPTYWWVAMLASMLVRFAASYRFLYYCNVFKYKKISQIHKDILPSISSEMRNCYCGKQWNKNGYIVTFIASLLKLNCAYKLSYAAVLLLLSPFVIPDVLCNMFCHTL